MAELVINLVVKGDGTAEIQKITKATDTAQQSTKKLESSFFSLGNVIRGIAIGALVKETVRLADAWTNAESRIRLATSSTKELVAVQKELFQVSQDNRIAFTSTAELYQRIALGTRDLKLQSKEIINLTDSINKAVVISGSSAVAADAAIVQLGQAFSANFKAVGQELASLREQTPRLYQAIIDGLGVTGDKFKQMAEDGQLSSELILAAIKSQGSTLNDEFGKIQKTIGQSGEQAKNSILATVAALDDATGASESLSSSISNLSRYLDENKQGFIDIAKWVREHNGVLKTSIGLIGGVAAAYYSFIAGGAIIAGIKGITASIYALRTAMIALQASSPILLAISVALGVATAAYLAHDDALEKKNYSGVKSINDLIKAHEDLRKKRADVQSDKFALDKTQRKETAIIDAELAKIEKRLNDIGNLQGTAALKTIKEAELAKLEVQKLLKTGASGASDKELSKIMKDKAKADKDRLKAIKDIAKEEHDANVQAMKDIQAVADGSKRLYEDQQKAIGDRLKLEFEADQQREQALKTFNEGQITAQIDYFDSVGDVSSAYYLKEEEKMRKLAETGWYTNEQMNAIKTADNEKFQKDQWEKDNKFWVDLFANINKAMDDQFFNAMTGKFNSFGSWLKDMWGSITQSMARGLSKTLADTMMGGLKGGLQNVFSGYGGLGGIFGATATPQALIGATTSNGLTTTLGGTVLDASGQIVTQGSDSVSVMGALNNASSVNSMYNMGMGAMYAPSAYMGQAAGMAYGAGFTGTGSFLAGSSQVLAGGSASGLSGSALAGGVGTAGVMGGVGGYALGALGDKLFGAQTQAANYGAIGGATGAMIGSVVPVIGTLVGGAIGAALGAVIGGFKGKTTQSITGTGVQAWGDVTADNLNLSSYADITTKKKSWFKSSESYRTEYQALSEKDKEGIIGVFETYEYLLTQLGGIGDIIVGAGKYSGQSFFNAIDKAFIRAFIDNKSLTDTFYTAWTSYASEIGKGVQETFATLISGYVDYTRSFQTWALRAGGNNLDALRLESEWAQQDLETIQSMYGTSGVTVENYLDMYNKAIKESFTPETITQWQSLGDALKKATEANSAYTDSLKASTSIIPADMMLKNVSTSNLSITDMVNKQASQIEQNAQSQAILYEIVKTLKASLTIQQFGTDTGVPA